MPYQLPVFDDAFRSARLNFEKIDINASSDSSAVVITGVADTRIVIVGGLIIASAAITLNFEDNAGSPVEFTGPITFAAQTNFVIPPDPTGQFVTTAGAGFVIDYNGTAQISGWLKYKLWKPSS